MSDNLSGGIQAISAESGKAIGSASKSSGSSDDGGLNELYKVNQVWYRLPPTLSLVAKRTLLTNNALQLQYSGTTFNQQITFIFNTGEYYVNMPSSYLYMEFGYNSSVRDYLPGTASAGAYNWAKALISQGNAMSLFEEISFTSASGTEICREQNKGLESAFRFRYENTQEYIDTIGQVQGAAKGSYSKNYDGVGPVFDQSLGGNSVMNGWSMLAPVGGSDSLVMPRTGDSETVFGTKVHNLNNSSYKVTPGYLSVCIPLDQVIGCFKPYMQTLYPAGALAGGRLDLRLKDPTESIQFIAGCVENKAADLNTSDTNNTYLQNLLTNRLSGFTINKIYLTLDSFQLQDNVLKRLNQVSAGQDGLSVLFDTYDHTVQTPSGAGSFEAQVQQARSRIVRSYCVVRDNANVTNPFVNSLAAEAAVTRVCQSCPPGFLNYWTQTQITSGNETGWDGSLTMLTIPSESNGGSGIDVPTTGGSTWNSMIVDNDGKSIGPWVYPWIIRPRLPGNVATSNGTADSAVPVFTTLQPTVGSYQAQLGALFFPQQPITTAPEQYQNALYIWGKGIPDKCETCSVSYEDFLGGIGWGLYDPTTSNANSRNVTPILTFPPNYTDPAGRTPNSNARFGTSNNPTCNSMAGRWIAPYGMAIYGMLAEKSSALQLSGLPISNARLLRHKFYFNTPPLSGTSRVVNVFTQFTRVMKVFLGGRVVIRE